MKKLVLLSALFLVSTSMFSQTEKDSISNQINVNAAQRLISKTDRSLTIGGYGEATFNLPEGDNAELDIQRLVLLVGYNFSENVQFVSEIEFEHVEEVFVEQAFVNYSVGDNISLRAGLMLIPMGIVNEYHEPTTFNGVERPALDNKIVPSTWREIGLGVKGSIPNISMNYQAYLFNGFKSTSMDGDEIKGHLKGSNGLRGGRQKGIKSTMDTPTFSAKVDYYGIIGLRLGLSGYFGKTQTEDDLESIDGTTVGVSMIGLDARYQFRKFSARGQFIYSSLSDTEDYNMLTGKDLGSEMMGYYVEGSYNLLPEEAKQKLDAFVRYENYNTHSDVDGEISKNEAYDRTDYTFGLSYHIVDGVVVKGDYQIRENALSGSDVKNQLNFGIGVWF
jgi:hypothetical protein